MNNFEGTGEVPEGSENTAGSRLLMAALMPWYFSGYTIMLTRLQYSYKRVFELKRYDQSRGLFIRGRRGYIHPVTMTGPSSMIVDSRAKMRTREELEAWYARTSAVT